MRKPFIRKTHVIDASGKTVGRLASLVATHLMGKRKVGYRPNADRGDFVLIKNAAEVTFTGAKLDQKVYYQFSGYPGGLKEIPVKRMIAKDASMTIRKAVTRMLPKNFIAKQMIKRLSFQK